ncbi:CBS domain-containing protein [Desulfotalea psychrophila]|uniref:Related to acetoin utilization protein (AcuB) n=1 Tax=Desulfotalea psychrophila (strain LSv54 / DSM 12343) TaxID=177439 RepID=Q6AJC1_DESPS|nr:CBS domain-containing protein [Desulfotalea psychrophila]CAG37559.1 related to acetoin utilization protein (AcuB) [Desulfotalea psychrophila LSv54]
MYISEYMTPEPLTIYPHTLLPEARGILDAFKFRHLPVVDDGQRLLGIITDRDLRSAYPSSLESGEESSGKFLGVEKTPVSEIMTVNCATIHPQATLDDALFLFDREKVGGVPVVNDQDLVVGMFSIRDLIAAYKNLFGVADKGSALIGIADSGEIGIMGTIVNILEKNGIAFTRLIRMPASDTEAKIYVRINTYRLAIVYKLLEQDGLTVLRPRFM